MTITKDGWELRKMDTNEPVTVGLFTCNSRGECARIEGGAPPHKPSSTGRVYTDRGEYYPGVFNMRWVKVEPQRFQSYVTENDRDELLGALHLIGQWIGDESMSPVRFDPNSEMHQLIVRLGRDIADWEQDFYNEQYAGNGRLEG